MDPSLVHDVKRRDLLISVRERGELHAAQDTRVSSKLEGRNTLIFLVPEGSVVKAGDKVAELDVGQIEEKRNSQAIAVAKAEAALEQAEKNFEIMEMELEASEATAASRQQIAKMRYEKLLGREHGQGSEASGTNGELVGKLRELLRTEADENPETEVEHAGLVGRVLGLLGTAKNLDLQMGELANQILRQISDISLARADLELAAETLRHSEKLAKRGFITRNELDRDTIAYRRQLSQDALAWNDLSLLVHYTLPETLISTQQEMQNAELGLASVRGGNEARRVREAAELRSAKAEFELAQERLDEWSQQMEDAILLAPSPGLVVYGRWDWDEPVYEGMEVRQRQEIVILPDVSIMVAELDVHEAQIDKVATGQIAMVKVDAFPDRSFEARVSQVSSLPKPTRSNDVKLYEVRVELAQDNTSGQLRPGMNATVELEVGTLTDVLAVPMPALDRKGDRHFVWMLSDDGPLATEVQLGSNNLTHVEITDGLQEGDQIYLVRPTGVELEDSDIDEKPKRSSGKDGSRGDKVKKISGDGEAAVKGQHVLKIDQPAGT
ncbi:MAG: HlyD family secretion protein [Planctomycetota bacterium]|jgi:HlyD family secretion protein